MAELKPAYLIHGLPGHPLHPPLTDAAIGAYTFAAAAAVLCAVGVAEHAFAQAWWLALLVGLASGGLAALAGLADWLQISRGSELWKTATLHMVVMVTATVLFLVAAITGHSDYVARSVSGGEVALTLVAFATLTAGGWIGGAITYVHGMRVLSLVDEPAGRAVAPVPHDEKVDAGS